MKNEPYKIELLDPILFYPILAAQYESLFFKDTISDTDKIKECNSAIAAINQFIGKINAKISKMTYKEIAEYAEHTEKSDQYTAGNRREMFVARYKKEILMQLKELGKTETYDIYTGKELENE